MKEMIRLGEALVSAGFIDNMQLQSALGHQRRWGGRLGKSLVELGFIDEASLIKFLSEKMKFPAVDLSRSHISQKAFESLPKKVAEKYMAVPILIKNTPGKKTMVLAMAEPTDLRAIDEIEFLTNFKIEAVVALESSIQKALSHYGQEENGAAKAPGIEIEKENGGRVEFVQGDLNMLDEVQKAENAYIRAGIQRSSPPPQNRTEPEPLARFDAPPLQDFEVIAEKQAADSPIEMVSAEEVPVETAEPVEDADVVDETVPVAEPESPAEADPYEFGVGIAEEVEEPEIAREATPEKASAPVEEDRNVAIVNSFEALEAAANNKPDAAPETVAETQPEPVPAEPESEYAVEAVENGENEDAAAVGEAAEYEPDAPETTPQAQTADETPFPHADCRIDEINSARMDIARLAGKIEGLVSLFILHAEGKLSTREFVKELKEL